MPQYRMTFFFESLEESNTTAPSAAHGWTETWYLNSSFASNLDLALAGVDTNNYIQARARCLNLVYSIWCVRAVEVTPGVKVRRSKLRFVRQDGSISAASALQVQCALVADIVKLPTALNEAAHHRRFLIRGLSIGDTTPGGNVWKPTGPSGASLRRFLNYLAKGQVGEGGGQPAAFAPFEHWQMRYNDPAVISQPITDLTLPAGAPTTIKVTSAALAAAAVGDKVVIQRVGFPRGVNRTWTVQALPVAPDTHWTLARSRFNLSGAWDGNGICTLVKPLFGAPDQFAILGLSSKKTGGLFRRARGRRRAAN